MFQLLPKHSAASILQSSNKHKKKQDKKKQVGPEEEKPGTESVRKNRENFTRYMYTVCRELEFSYLRYQGGVNDSKSFLFSLLTCTCSLKKRNIYNSDSLLNRWNLIHKCAYRKIKISRAFMFDKLHWILFSCFTMALELWLS